VRFALAPLRLALLVAHILLGLAILFAIFPWSVQVTRNRIVRGWSRVLVAICGARLMVSGRALDAVLARDGMRAGTPGRLLVANHISWLDVFAIHAVLPGRFVAKAEIRRWLLLGALVTRSGTLYIERGRRHAVATINHRVAQHLQAGESVTIFPESTTTDGTELLPFHSNLFASALHAAAPVWPVALRYTERGTPTTGPAFIGDMGLITSLARILTARDLAVEVALLDELSTAEHPNRHALARAAHAAIAMQLALSISASPISVGCSGST
jgi:1-acyl-sn-glycerol-3-phosphate acyltransferase